MSDYSTKKMPSIRLSHFINLSDSFSSDNVSKSLNSTKSSRNFEGGVVGLGIVAAMNEINDSHEAFFSANTSKAVKIAVSARSEPIPIVSAKSVTRFREPILDKDEMEMSESYTCVISRFGKREYVDETDGINGNYLADSEMFFASPQAPTLFQAADFLSSCYLCRKKLHGLDIFMYRGDKAFCSVECRCKQILSDEHKEKCGSGALKSFDYSVSPCSGPRLFSTGVTAA